MSIPLAFGWRHLLFANWSVPTETVDAHLPEQLSVEAYDGSAWLSIVCVYNTKVRMRGLPRWAGMPMPQVNVRTYVSRDREPGVYFFSIDAESVLSFLGGRITHRLPYHYARMNFGVDTGRVTYHSRRFHPGARPAHFSVSCEPTGETFESDAGSLAEFLTERRRMYTQSQDGSLRFTDIEHPRWRLSAAEKSIDENELFEANGFEVPDEEPTLYYSPGVSVTTTRSRRWRGA